MTALARRRNAAAASAAARTFTPTDLTGLRVWYDASQLTGLTDTALVPSLTDFSGAGLHAVQADNTKQPVYRTAQQNGLPCVRFDGSNDFMSVAYPASISSPISVIAVCKVNAFGTSSRFILDGRLTTTERGHQLLINSSGSLIISAGTNVTSTAQGTTTRLTAAIFKGANTWYQRDGTSLGMNVNPGTQAANGLTLGSNQGQTSGFLNFDLHELLIYSRELYTPEVLSIEAYLAAKWGLTISTRYNARQALTIPTYDGSGQAVHPDVVDMGSPWNGWRYWMAMTPYPAGDPAIENPSIVVSSDGYTWQVPAGLTNPITPPSGVVGIHNADTDLTYDNANDRLICLYTYRDDPTYEIRARTSSDGITWSSATTLKTSTTRKFASPALLKDGSTWRMWAVDYSPASPNQNVVYYYTSTDPLSGWDAGTAITLNTIAADRDPWHLDVAKIGNGYHMALMEAALDANTAGKMRLGRSSDGITWNLSSVVIDLGVSSEWDNNRIYRGSITPSGDKYRLWYSAEVGNVWRTSYTELPKSLAPALP